MARNARVGNMAKMERTFLSLANILMRQQSRATTLAKKVYLANMHQSLIKNSNEMAKEPFISADFEEIGELGKNDENSPKPLEKVE